MIIVILLYFNPSYPAEAPQMVLEVVLGCVYFNAMLWNRGMGVFLKLLFQRNTFYVKALLFTWYCRTIVIVECWTFGSYWYVTLFFLWQ